MTIGKLDLHARLPEDTLAKLDEMAAADAAHGDRPDRGRWLTAMIEAEWARREAAMPVRRPRSSGSRSGHDPAKNGGKRR